MGARLLAGLLWCFGLFFGYGEKRRLDGTGRCDVREKRVAFEACPKNNILNKVYKTTQIQRTPGSTSIEEACLRWEHDYFNPV